MTENKILLASRTGLEPVTPFGTQRERLVRLANFSTGTKDGTDCRQECLSSCRSTFELLPGQIGEDGFEPPTYSSMKYLQPEVYRLVSAPRVGLGTKA